MTPAIDVRIDAARWSDALPAVRRLCRESARAALAAGAPELGAAELRIVLSDDVTVAALNRDFRHRDAPTNVLAFATETTGPDGWAPMAGDSPRLLGDVVVAYETAVTEARDGHRSLEHHLCHLIVHGVLHLLGYDHDADAEADRMEDLEVRILRGFGIDDPYRDRESSPA